MFSFFTNSCNANVKEAGLKVPFESGCLKDTVQLVREWFEKADDSQF